MFKIVAHFTLLFALSFSYPFSPVFSQSGEVTATEKKPADSNYRRVVKIVILENTNPERMEQTLAGISKIWGLFPSLEYLPHPVPGGEKAVLLLRGYADEVDLAREIAESLDRAVGASPALFPLPLDHLRAPLMKEKLLDLSRSAGLGWEKEQFLIFPPGSRGSLFFRGGGEEAKKVKELKNALDQPYYGSFLDSWVNFWRVFRRDAASHFITIATYVASALLLILLHFIFINIPWLGKRYEKWFTLIWTKVLDTVKGREFAFEVIKSIAEIAVESTEQYAVGEVKRGLTSGAEVKGEGKKERARSIARELLIYRGFNPDDPQVQRIVDNVIEARIYELKSRKVD